MNLVVKFRFFLIMGFFFRKWYLFLFCLLFMKLNEKLKFLAKIDKVFFIFRVFLLLFF